MKHLSLLISMFCALCLPHQVMHAQNAPPKAAKDFLKAQYGSCEAMWDDLGDLVLATVNCAGNRHEVLFNTEGQWLESITVLADKHLPDNIQQMLTERYGPFRCETALFSLTANEQQHYLLSIQTANEYIDLKLSAQGTIVNESREAIAQDFLRLPD